MACNLLLRRILKKLEQGNNKGIRRMWNKKTGALVWVPVDESVFSKIYFQFCHLTNSSMKVVGIGRECVV